LIHYIVICCTLEGPISGPFFVWQFTEAALYHENRISQVQNFVFQLPLKNIVQGRKGYLKVEKKIPWETCFPLFYPSKAGKKK
jgi:hypothetical protein